jgi:hypothetical protein
MDRQKETSKDAGVCKTYPGSGHVMMGMNQDTGLTEENLRVTNGCD